MHLSGRQGRATVKQMGKFELQVLNIRIIKSHGGHPNRAGTVSKGFPELITNMYLYLTLMW